MCTICGKVKYGIELDDSTLCEENQVCGGHQNSMARKLLCSIWFVQM